MHIKNSMMLLLLFSTFVIVHGQLSVDELFFFNSKYTSTGNCSNFQYTFTTIRINSNNYNQVIFDCDSSSIILRNTEQISSSVCSNDENYLDNFRIHFHSLSQTLIQVNQLHFHGIELCSLDELIQKHYSEYSYYRSQWALLVNLENNDKKDRHHLAIATNGEMTFILFILSSENSTALRDNQIELIFPNENIFKFNRSSINIWRIDQGYVRSPKSLANSIIYQLSKSNFMLFNNETFFLYGTQISYPTRFVVSIDETSVTCNYDYILRCKFPILPLSIRDTDKLMLKVNYDRKSIFNATLTLIPRIRLGQVPTSHSISDIETFKVNLDENLCANNLLKSLFTLIIYLRTENVNGTARYQKIVKNDIEPMDCNATAEIGQVIGNITNPIPIDDIISLNVDLIHRWYNHQNCRTEQTRINFN